LWDRDHQQIRSFADHWAGGLVHSAVRSATISAGFRQNADSVEQVIDFIEKIPAQIVIDLSRVKIGAASRGTQGYFCTKLSTTFVGLLLRTAGFSYRAVGAR
jgi:hypothetical protein